MRKRLKFTIQLIKLNKTGFLMCTMYFPTEEVLVATYDGGGRVKINKYKMSKTVDTICPIQPLFQHHHP